MKKFIQIIGSFSALVLLCILNCKTTHESSSTLGVEEKSSGLLGWLNKPLGYKDLFISQTVGEFTRIGRIREDSCQALVNQKPELVQIEIEMVSDLGTHLFSFAFSATEKLPGVTVSIDQVSILLHSENPPPTTFESWCSEISQDANIDGFLLSEEGKNFILASLGQMNPDCSFERRIRNNSPHLYCQLDTMDVVEAKRRLLALKNIMIRRWSRQPYLLSRRLALSLQLVDVLSESEFPRKENPFCPVLALSHPFEKPASMMSPKWQKDVCDPEAENPKQAAMVGLDRAVTELEAMRLLYEKQSRAGLLRVEIPRTPDLPRSFVVSLKPLRGEGIGAERPLASVEALSSGLERRLCWSPLFGGDEHLLAIARSLGLTGENQNMDCLLSVDATTVSTTPNMWQFLSDSLTSETEFVITNGRSKVLQLPTGHYEYEIRPSWESEVEWELAGDVLRKGVIFWDAKAPRPVAKIDKW